MTQQGRSLYKGTYAHVPPVLAPRDGADKDSQGTGILITIDFDSPPFIPIISVDPSVVGAVDSVTDDNTGVTVDNTDPQNPVLGFDPAEAGVVETVTGDNTGVDVDATDPQNLVLSFDSGDSGVVESVTGDTNGIDVDNSDPQNPIVQFDATEAGVVQTVTNDDGTLNLTRTGTDLNIDTYPSDYRVHTVYIAPTGNDSTGDGTSGSPWFSLHKALDMCNRIDCTHFRVLCATGVYDYSSLGKVDISHTRPVIVIGCSTTTGARAQFYWQYSISGTDAGFNIADATVYLAAIQIYTDQTTYASANGTGLALSLSAKVYYVNVYVLRWQYGVYMGTSSRLAFGQSTDSWTYTTKEALIVYETRSQGIVVNDHSTLRFFNSTMNYNVGSCIQVLKGSYAYIDNSLVTTGGSHGIETGTWGRSYVYLCTVKCINSGKTAVTGAATADIRIESCTIDNLSLGAFGVYCANTTRVWITGSTIQNCASVGVLCSDQGVVRLSSSITFSGNGSNTSPSITTANVPSYGNDMGIISQ